MPVDGGTAIVNVVANGAGLSASIASAVQGGLKKATSAIKGSANQLGGAMGLAFTSAATVGAAALAALTVAGISDFQKIGGEVRTLEKQLGATAEQASVLRAQAEAVGVATDKLSVGFGIFAKHLVAGDDVLAQYGVTVQKTADGQIDFGAQLAQLSGIFSEMDPGLERTAAAMNLFGRSGKALLPLLGANSEELATFAANAEAAGLIMSEEDVVAARELSIAQRELGESFKGLEVGLARAVIPLLSDLANILATAVRAISPFLPLIRNLGLAFLGYKALMFVPPLLLSIAAGFEAIGATGIANALLSSSVAVAGFTTVALPAAAAATLFAGALVAGTAALTAWDPLNLINANIDEFNSKLILGTSQVGKFTTHIGVGRIAITGLASHVDALVGDSGPGGKGIAALPHLLDAASNSAGRFAGLTVQHLKEFKTAVVASVQVTIGQFDSLKAAFGTSAQALKRQADLAVKIARQQHRDLKAIFDDKTLTEGQQKALAQLPAEQRHAFAEGGKQIRAQIAHDAIALQRLNDQTFNQITKSATAKAKTGGQAAGKALGDGVAAGIAAGTGPAVAAANTLGNNVIQALRDSMDIHSPSGEGVKAGRSLIQGLVIGIQSQFRSVERILGDLVPLMQKAIGAGAADQAKAFLRDLEALDKRFEKLKTKVGNFKSAIRGAFTDAADLIGGIGAALEQFRSEQEQFLQDQASFTGAEGQVAPVAPESPDIQALVSAQVAQAQQLAKLLKQLQDKGLSVANLSDLAGQGAGAIPIAEALLNDPTLIQSLNDAQQQIADITQRTADQMTNAAFGDKVEAMGRQLDQLLTKLHEFLAGLDVPALKDETRDFINQLRRLNEALQGFGVGGGGAAPNPGGGSNITINVNAGPGTDGQQVGRDIRDALLTLQRRNGTTGL